MRVVAITPIHVTDEELAGGAAVGISGHGSDGYLAGNGLLPAFGFSYLAAKTVASQLSLR